jgi:hypothetical protein
MKRLLVLVTVVAAALAFATAAAARPLSVEAPELKAVASAIAGQDLEVRCWLDDQDEDYLADTWGYVFLEAPVVYLDPAVCAGAKALVAGTMLPLWQLGLGALVLTHESYHLKTALPYWRRGSEPQTECRAIKRVRQTILDLGASEALADSILPWALAIHWRITTLAPEYDYPHCRVPVFSEFWPS